MGRLVEHRPAPPMAARGWGAFVRERFSLPALAVLGLLQAASAQLVVAPGLDVPALIAAAAGIVGLLALMRLMDELKDLDKDRVAHPERPLPRGAVREGEARRVLRWGIGLLLSAAALMAVGLDPVAGALYGACILYSILMYVEFFAPEFLEARPFLYAATHQVVVLPIYAFATATAFPELATSRPVLWFGLTGLGASFAFEVCRKLAPDAHPALGTYLSVHGRGPTITAIALAVLVASLAAYPIGTHALVWPAAALLLLASSVTVFRPERYRRAEAAAALFVLVQVSAPTVLRVLEAIR